MQIHELPEAVNVTATDMIAIDTGTETYKVPASVLITALKSIGSLVTGVKGDKESAYRTGDVNITPANIGAIPSEGGEITGSISMATDDDYDVAHTDVISHFLMALTDVNDVSRHQVATTINPSGTYYTMLQVRNESGINQIGVGMDGSGNSRYVITSPDAFRSTIGAISLSDIVLRTGTYSGGSVAANTRGNATVTFESVGTSNYMVVLTPLVGEISCGAQNKTATSFDLYYKNTDTTNARAGTINWTIIKLP